MLGNTRTSAAAKYHWSLVISRQNANVLTVMGNAPLVYCKVANNDRWKRRSGLPCGRSLPECVLGDGWFNLCTLIAHWMCNRCAASPSLPSVWPVCQTMWGSINQPSPTHTQFYVILPTGDWWFYHFTMAHSEQPFWYCLAFIITTGLWSFYHKYWDGGM